TATSTGTGANAATRSERTRQQLEARGREAVRDDVRDTEHGQQHDHDHDDRDEGAAALALPRVPARDPGNDAAGHDRSEARDEGCDREADEIEQPDENPALPDPRPEHPVDRRRDNGHEANKQRALEQTPDKVVDRDLGAAL